MEQLRKMAMQRLIMKGNCTIPLLNALAPLLMRMIIITLIVIPVLGCIYMDKQPVSPLLTVADVDLQRYIGVWHEIARYPNRFQENCFGSRATYALRNDGAISVLNECYDSSFEGKLRSVEGKAKVVDAASNAKLKVSFFWPFSGDYWIIELGKDYEYAVIGHPKRKYLWILSRSTTIDETVYEGILSRLKDKQYDITKLIKTPQK